MHPNHAHRLLGVRHPLVHRQRDNKRSVPSGNPYAGQPPIPLSIPLETGEEQHGQTAPDYENTVGGVGLLSPEGPAVDAEEEAFIRAMQRKRKKKRRKGLGM